MGERKQAHTDTGFQWPQRRKNKRPGALHWHPNAISSSQGHFGNIPLMLCTLSSLGFPAGSDSKESSCKFDPGFDPLGEGVVTHFSILAWRIPWTEKPGALQSMGSQRVRHDWVTKHTLLSSLVRGRFEVQDPSGPVLQASPLAGPQMRTVWLKQEAGSQNFLVNLAQPVAKALKPLDNTLRDSGPGCQILQDRNDWGPRLFMLPLERAEQSLPPPVWSTVEIQYFLLSRWSIFSKTPLCAFYMLTLHPSSALNSYHPGSPWYSVTARHLTISVSGGGGGIQGKSWLHLMAKKTYFWQ